MCTGGLDTIQLKRSEGGSAAQQSERWRVAPGRLSAAARRASASASSMWSRREAVLARSAAPMVPDPQQKSRTAAVGDGGEGSTRSNAAVMTSSPPPAKRPGRVSHGTASSPPPRRSSPRSSHAAGSARSTPPEALLRLASTTAPPTSKLSSLAPLPRCEAATPLRLPAPPRARSPSKRRVAPMRAGAASMPSQRQPPTHSGAPGLSQLAAACNASSRPARVCGSRSTAASNSPPRGHSSPSRPTAASLNLFHV